MTAPRLRPGPLSRMNTVDNLQPTSRHLWRQRVERSLIEAGAAVQQTETGAYRIAKGSAYLVTSDLAHLSERDLEKFAKA